MEHLGILCLVIFWVPKTVTSYSIEKHILNSASKAEMFDLFHVMPDGMMKVIHELDMLLNLDQYKQLYMDDKHKRSRRKASADMASRWPLCKVYYEITESLDTKTDRKLIRDAMDEWEKFSCLEFIENPNKPRRIQFADGEMCASAVGMQKGVQTLHLASGCRTKGIVTHEIGHAVGWFHEHMRPDRDEYINIHFSAIPEKYRMHYKKYNTDVINTYNIPYDYTSIMHYGDGAFPGSMVARDPKYQKILGQRIGLSFKDIKLANVMYDCGKVMGCSNKNCGDGFQFYKSYKGKRACQCWCDSGNVEDPLILCSERKVTQAPPVPTLPPPTVEPKMACMDVREDCKVLKELGKCMSKMVLMKNNCAKTCGFCDKGNDMCMDYEAGCGLMADYCTDPGLKATMSQMCMASCDLCLAPPDPCEIHKEMLGDHNLENIATGKEGNFVMVMLSSSVTIMTAVFIGDVISL